MPFIYLFGIIAACAYLFQGVLGFIQIKHFTKVYGEMRRQGRVAIGRKSGKFKAGTIVMLALDPQGIIIEARKIQGTTVLAKFKPLTAMTGYHIFELSPKVPCVAEENKLTIATIMDAVDVYRRVMNGEIIEEKTAPFMSVGNKLNMLKFSIQTKFRGSVNK